MHPTTTLLRSRRVGISIYSTTLLYGSLKAAPDRSKGAARGIIKAGARKPRPDKRRAMGRIEHTLLVGGWLHLNRPKTFAHSPLATPPYHKKLQMFLFTTKGRSPIAWELRPMREAGALSTGRCNAFRGVIASPGIGMFAPLALLRNAEGTQSEGRVA
jgi:hypothetical protein